MAQAVVEFSLEGGEQVVVLSAPKGAISIYRITAITGALLVNAIRDNEITDQHHLSPGGAVDVEGYRITVVNFSDGGPIRGTYEFIHGGHGG